MIVGALIRYTGSTTPLQHIPVVPENSSQLYHLALPPDTLWLKFPVKDSAVNKTYGYRFRGEIVDLENNEIDLKVNTELVNTVGRININFSTKHYIGTRYLL